MIRGKDANRGKLDGFDAAGIRQSDSIWNHQCVSPLTILPGRCSRTFSPGVKLRSDIDAPVRARCS